MIVPNGPTPEPFDDSPPSRHGSSRDERLHSVVEDYLLALERGESLSRARVVASHPDLAADLEDRLLAVEAMFDLAVTSSEGGVEEDGGVALRCPHCRLELRLDTWEPAGARGGPAETYFCPSCSGEFSVEDSEAAEVDIRPGTTIGRFEIVREVGRGAFGAVWEAIDSELERRVAVKVPRSGTLATHHETQRFLREARSAAQLRHANIVTVHEVGEFGGVPYLVTDLVDGRDLAAVIAEHRPTHRASAALVARVGEALHFGHERGIVHRDVKPGNILLSSLGEPHVTDFGLARREEGDVTVTLDGQLIGTPAYMSPEQARGDHEKVDRRSDVWSLGVVLYELLTGERPFRGSRSMILHQVEFDDPRSPRSLDERIPADLETICMKALEKDRDARYSTARELAEDLRRFLTGESIIARPTSRWERLRRWCRRRPTTATLLAVLVCVGGLVALGSTLAAFRFGRLADESRGRLVRAHVQNGERSLAGQDPADSLPWFLEALRVDRGDSGRQRRHRARVLSVLNSQPIPCRIWFSRHPVTHAEFSETGEFVLTASGNDVRVMEIESGAQLESFEASARVVAARLSPNGDAVAWMSEDGALSWRGTRRESPAGDVALRPGGGILKFHPGGDLLAILQGGVLRTWSLATGHAQEEFESASAVMDFDFSADGLLLLIAHADGKVLVRRVGGNGDEIRRWSMRPPVTLVRLSHDAKAFFACGAGQLNAFRLQGDPLLRGWGIGGRVVDVVWSPHDRTAVAPTADGWLYYWYPDRNWYHMSDTRGNAFESVAMDPAGLIIAAGQSDGVTRLYEARTLTPRSGALKHAGAVTAVEFHPTDPLLLTASADGTTRIWDLSRGPRTATASPAVDATTVEPTLRSDRRELRKGPGSLRVISMDREEPLSPSLPHPGPVSWASFERGGEWITSASSTRARLWHAATGEALTPWLAHPSEVTSVSCAADSSSLTVTTRDGGTWCWDLAADELSAEQAELLARIVSAASVDSTGSLEPLTAADLEGVWGRLRAARWRPTLPSIEECMAWHAREADRAVSAQRWPEAFWHLDRPLDEFPDEERRRLQRAMAAAELGQASRAMSDHEWLVEKGFADVEAFQRLALLYLSQGNLLGYRGTCERALERFREERSDRARREAVRCCVFGPGGLVDSRENLERVMAQTVPIPVAVERLEVVAALAFRDGDPERAVSLLLSAQVGRGESTPWIDVFSGLAHAKRGAMGAAREHFVRFRERAATGTGAPHPSHPEASVRIRLEQELLGAELSKALEPTTPDH